VRKLITEYNDWIETFNLLSQEKIVAFDLEANGMHAYPEHICLLQFGTVEDQFIVYPEALGNADELRAFFQNEEIEKIFHSCDYDIRSLFRDYNIVVKNMFDTSVGAQFLGASQLGLANVLNRFLNLEIEKNTKIQKMDWGKRPLSENELKYAADDVFHLIDLRNLLVEKLEKLNRLNWVKEEIIRLIKVRFGENVSMENSFLRIKGVRALRPHQLAVLRELSIFREKLALKKNSPPYKIIGNKTLITLAINPETDINSLKGIGKWLLNQARKDLADALNRGVKAEPVSLPKLPRRPVWSNSANARLSILKEWRLRKGTELSLDPAILWPVASLQRMARKPAELSENLSDVNNSDVRTWQKKLFAKELKILVKSF